MQPTQYSTGEIVLFRENGLVSTKYAEISIICPFSTKQDKLHPCTKFRVGYDVCKIILTFRQSKNSIWRGAEDN